ncbi:hypothetical protein [Streptomyces virginiae]|uniref:hypothetical protein n=1 Tax=Streptomyces virginiae TaxID=1961 RepID=UPI0030E3B4B7
MMFAKHFDYDEKRAAAIMELREREAIKEPRLLIQGLGVLALVVAGFVLHRPASSLSSAPVC